MVCLSCLRLKPKNSITFLNNAGALAIGVFILGTTVISLRCSMLSTTPETTSSIDTYFEIPELPLHTALPAGSFLILSIIVVLKKVG